ncbi:MAG: hypothetical protein IJZ47_12355 [Oscillospiraceae bacterium]|nr:hypothetical protein [Oscillospiraceae bacterium]
MAKYECELRGDFNTILSELDEAATKSLTAELEDESHFSGSDFRCAVRVYERYSVVGSNRVSLNITLVENGGRLFCSAISSGGSQAVFFKLNTFGEEAFLDTITDVLKKYEV